MSNFLFYCSLILEKVPTAPAAKPVLEQIERICHEFRLLPYPYFYPAAKLMSLVDMELKCPGHAKFKKYPEIFKQLSSFNMKD